MSASSASLDSLLEQCIVALEADDRAAVDAVLRAHPTHEPELRTRLDRLAALGILHAPRTAPAIPERLGEFRLLRQIGRGGMGVVHLAEQTPLQRQVALKLVHPEQLFFPGARERFRREVLAVARLQHPGIVPILTCGEAEGIPYYAMELVAGASLGEVLVELAGTAPAALAGPVLRSALQRAMAKKHDVTAVHDAAPFRGTWSHGIASLVRDTARALAHAHAQGVLHRDVKPSNLLLTTDGAARLIDFGLASSRGDSRLTRSGATLGSVPYMAPEQVRGDSRAIDARTDVYQLGVTLYELLSLALPHGDGSGDTRERILAGHVRPPSHHTPSVHPDLEAICLRAMAAEAKLRYPSALAFADDLTAFLEQRPVTARTPGALRRGRRWARRHPMRTALLLGATCVLVPGPLAFGWQQHNANRRILAALADARTAHAEAETQARVAQQQRSLAEQRLDEALAAVDRLLQRTGEARLARLPGTAALRADLLADALASHERLAAAAGQSPRLAFARSRSASRLGTLQVDLGDLAAGQAQLERARDRLAELLPDAADPLAVRSELALCLEALAGVYGRTGQGDAYEATQRTAHEHFAALAAQQPERRFVEGDLRSDLGLARALARRRQLPAALARLDALDARFEAAVVRGNGLPELARRRLHAEIAEGRGVLLAQGGRPDDALLAFRTAAARLTATDATTDDDDELLPTLASVHERLGLVLSQLRRWNEAAEPLDHALHAYERLLRREPEYPQWPLALARLLGTRADNQRQQGDTEGLLAEHDRAIALLTPLHTSSPQEDELTMALAIAHAERAGCAHQRRALDDAAAGFAAAEALLEPLVHAHHDDPRIAANLAAVLANHATLQIERGDAGAARARLRRALALGDPVRGPAGARQRVEVLARLIALQIADGELDAAAGSVVAARTTAQDPALDPRLQQGLTAHAMECEGMLAFARGDAATAAHHWHGAQAAATAAGDALPDPRLPGRVALHLCRAARHANDLPTARRHLQAARAAGATAGQPGLPQPLSELFADPTLSVHASGGTDG